MRQHFLSEEQNLDLLIAELPEGVYAVDRADDPNPAKRSYSSSELRAASRLEAMVYENLRLIYLDKFISTATEVGITQWERDLFKDPQDTSLDLEVRRAKALGKYRQIGSISLPAIVSVIHSVLDPVGIPFIVRSSCQTSEDEGTPSWVFEVSLLGFDTYLADGDPLAGAVVTNPLDCDLDYIAAGLTLAQFLAIQNTAYSYEVLLLGVADAQTLTLLDRRLTESEPARSTHHIINNWMPLVDDGPTEQWNTDFLPNWVA